MNKIKLVIFDLDGTLVDAYPAINRSFNYTMRQINYPCRDSLVIRRAVGWGDRNLLKPFVKRADLTKALEIYRRHHRESLIRWSSLLPGASRVLSGLKSKGYKLAVASNRPTRFSRVIIRHLELNKYFAYVLCADKLQHMKPHPEILNKILRRFSLRPEQAIYVGDMAIDAQTGRKAKLRTIIVTTGSSSRREIVKENPYRIIKSITALSGLL
jgi:phosphoglycolate phosphatase